ncbi:MAG: hypothetical protein EIB84_00195 (plasmid) [Spiroplasma poulsonii]|uniref:Plectrovirus spv1-c74 ORF 12 transmembrane protein n=1 Tax=Spiroplasma poulsonii TaxID=2138 RepID=A0A2P6F8C2_9MOLU|nr:hypothetical protein [Spiroplasma poulsonii]MBW1241342.1 hypothetical protein [Spiroplasma poulsonii]PQM29673.1 Plectrovirus spv1-c74 ORF 12 transmembrane protein [Spiroplasma poulsonii]PQM29685.1 Plectrovirus spv1-c74 ORF 12 transmembrane protein [Spiroplasma poulsonii]PQM29697.1 Plectrovirus spv1-c74 ORF 12 transmembrane protein [Spiroplasma poulsonii]
MAAWLSYVIFGVIVIGSFIAIGLTIYRRILEIKKYKKEKKEIERKEDKK